MPDQDAELDIPGAAHFIALFLGRAVVDEVLPPAFLAHALGRLGDDSLGVHAVQSVRALPCLSLSATHLRRWGP